jgi:hypothetical protein
MTDWQPIETAPKDGSFILSGYWIDVGLDDCRPVFFNDVVFFHKDNPSPRAKKGKWYTAATGDEAETPTHWMPLPEPPK